MDWLNFGFTLDNVLMFSRWPFQDDVGNIGKSSIFRIHSRWFNESHKRLVDTNIGQKGFRTKAYHVINWYERPVHIFPLEIVRPRRNIIPWNNTLGNTDWWDTDCDRTFSQIRAVIEYLKHIGINLLGSQSLIFWPKLHHICPDYTLFGYLYCYIYGFNLFC